MNKNQEIISLRKKIMSVLLETPEDRYQEEKILALYVYGVATEHTRRFWRVVFAEADLRRPLLLECAEETDDKF